MSRGGAFYRRLRIELLEDRRLLAVVGDYNGNNIVDAADYVVWRSSVGLTGTQPADGNGDLKVNDLDHGIWREHFGEELQAPGAFSITGPNFLDEDGNFTITWGASSGATSYELILSQFSNMTSPYLSETLTATSRVFSGFGESTNYIGVIAKNAAGNTMATNFGRVLTIDAPEVNQVIFVTSQNYFIDDVDTVPPLVQSFGSAHAADYHMTNIANQIGLLQNWDGHSIYFFAMLTVSFNDLTNRASIGNDSFFNVHGDLIASSREQLFSGVHSAPILNELGQAVVGNAPVWTGATGTGQWSGFTADDWSNPFSSGASVGNVNGSGTTWVSNGTRAANLGARLYGIGVPQGPAHNNTPPAVSPPIADQSIPAGTPFSLATASAFHDVDTTDPFHYYAWQTSGIPLPSWLTFNQDTGLLSGTPAAGNVGTISIEVTAVETYGGQIVSDQFQLTVTAAGAGSGGQVGSVEGGVGSAASVERGGRSVEAASADFLRSAVVKTHFGAMRSVAFPIHPHSGPLPEREGIRRDAALVAWLGSRGNGREESFEMNAAAGDQDVVDEVDRAFDGLDVAFGALVNADLR